LHFLVLAWWPVSDFLRDTFISLWAGMIRGVRMRFVDVAVTFLVQNQGIEIQRAMNLHKFRSWVYLFIALGNVLISIPLVRAYGGLGAALGTALALFLGNILIMNWYYHKKIGLNIYFFGKQIAAILPGLILPVVCGYLILRFVDLMNIPGFILSALLFIVLYILSVWFFSLNAYEKELVLKPLKRVSERFRKR
jgi:O-antigen/teichoic acid export membrane protein